MKATMFAVVLSCFVISLPHQAIAQEVKPAASLPVTQSTLEKISLNKATIQELTGSFKGIGKMRAEAIVSYRDAHGGFKSIEDLAQVHGLGKRFVDRNLTQLQNVFTVK